ncbi:MAG: hypothetical protein JWP08_3320 [Bryobacterales bacterium]|nr:hypothetical protein [Bryobacterales bacterium]
MKSAQKLSANRKNACKSTGPRTAAGKARAARNALNHGLNIPIKSIPEFRKDIENLAMLIAHASGKETVTELFRQAAEAQLETLRIRKARARILSTDSPWEDRNAKLAKLERYERRAFSRALHALRGIG